MKIVEVHNEETARAFLKVPRNIYRNDPNWIPHLENDVEKVFDPSANKQFRSGEVTRWILTNDNGEVIGRVASFINRNLAYTYPQPTGGMGFFECIDDEDAAFLLFDTCKHWLRERGMEAMDGPVNFGEKERFWGLLTDGFGKPPPYLMNYNPPYYKTLFEKYGFRNYYEQYVYQIDPHTRLPDILRKKYERLTSTQGYHFEHLQKKRLDKYAGDFMTIYNKAWGEAHQNFKPMSKDQALKAFTEMRQIVDEKLIIFCYHHNEPVAFFVTIPELNEIFRYVDGKLDVWGKLKFLYYRWKGKCQTLYGLVFGIVPEYQNRGLESALIMSLQNTISGNKTYKSMYITWLGDFNPKMIRIVEHIGATRAFTLITYRYLFDRTARFERHPVLD